MEERPMKKQMERYRSVMLLGLMLMPGLIAAGNPKKDDLQDQVDQLDQRVIALETVEVCPPGAPTRFVDNGDGTICDHQAGLMWEMKDAGNGFPDFSNPHSVDNWYTWTNENVDPVGATPDGTAFIDFLAQLNGEATNDADMAGVGFAGYTDWRLANLAELRTILDCSFGPPCIDPIFGQTLASRYWSSTSFALALDNAWTVNFDDGSLSSNIGKNNLLFVRAVRGGR